MADTRDAILLAARELFVRQGYTATSIRQIAEAAGIGKATVYHHFTDKQSLIMALMKDTGEHQKTILQNLEAEVDPRTRIETALKSSVRILLKDMGIIQIARRELPSGKEIMKEHYAGFLKDFRHLLAGAIREGILGKTFREIDPATGAKVLMTMIQGTFSMAYLSGERPASAEETANDLLDVFFRGIDSR